MIRIGAYKNIHISTVSDENVWKCIVAYTHISQVSLGTENTIQNSPENGFQT